MCTWVAEYIEYRSIIIQMSKGHSSTRFVAHMHETVEEKAARLERKRRIEAADASGSGLPPPAAVWNNSNWARKREEEEEDGHRSGRRHLAI